MNQLSKRNDTLPVVDADGKEVLTHAEVILAAAYVQHMSVNAAAAECGIDPYTARKVLSKEHVKRQVDAMVLLRTEAMATTADWTLATQKSVIEKAIEKGDMNGANVGLKHLGEFHGLWGKRTNIIPPKQVYDQRQIIFMQNGETSTEENLKLADALNRDVVGLPKLDAPTEALLHGAGEAGAVQEP